MTLNSCEGRERVGKPRKGWLNELSCKKSLAHVHEVKGQSLCNAYVAGVVETLVENCRFICTGCILKKALMQQLISELPLNNL